MKRILDITRRFRQPQTVRLDDLPEHGRRASWHTDKDWRALIKDELTGHCPSYWPEPFHQDSALGELSLEFYLAGDNLIRVSVPMPGIDETVETPRERPVEEPQPPFGPN